MRLIDPFIDFTAAVGGTYYVAVSGVGNDEYSASVWVTAA